MNSLLVLWLSWDDVKLRPLSCYYLLSWDDVKLRPLRHCFCLGLAINASITLLDSGFVLFLFGFSWVVHKFSWGVLANLCPLPTHYVNGFWESIFLLLCFDGWSVLVRVRVVAYAFSCVVSRIHNFDVFSCIASWSLPDLLLWVLTFYTFCTWYDVTVNGMVNYPDRGRQ